MFETIQQHAPMSQNKFAVIAGVKPKQVSVWKSKGYLVFTEDGLVDPAPSIRNLIDRGFGNFGTVTPGVTPEISPADQITPIDPFENYAAEAAAEEATLMDVAVDIMSSVDFDLMPFKDAERMKENFLALTQRLNYENKVGALVDKAEYDALHAQRWSIERNSWEVWPSSICATMAAKLGVDQTKMRVALEEAVHEQLSSRVRAAIDEQS